MKPITLEKLAELKKAVADKKKSPKKKTKYNSVSVVKKGVRFDSKLEAAYYEYLLACKASGEVLYFLRQVAFHLPGRVKYLCDFALFYRSGEVRYIDIKGFLTPTSNLKIKQVQDLYPVDIELITKEDLKRMGII